MTIQLERRRVPLSEAEIRFNPAFKEEKIKMFYAALNDFMDDEDDDDYLPF